MANNNADAGNKKAETLIEENPPRGKVPVVLYSNADTQKAAIIMENKKKSGVYM